MRGLFISVLLEGMVNKRFLTSIFPAHQKLLPLTMGLMVPYIAKLAKALNTILTSVHLREMTLMNTKA
jgi:hypothetical protein